MGNFSEGEHIYTFIYILHIIICTNTSLYIGIHQLHTNNFVVTALQKQTKNSLSHTIQSEQDFMHVKRLLQVGPSPCDISS